jgi:hypothetical protein
MFKEWGGAVPPLINQITNFMTYKHIITKGVTAAVCAVATLSFVLSCTKEQVSEAERSSVVTFSIPGVSSGSISTKASLDDITAALVATQPTATPTLTIRSTADNSVSYTAEVGTPISLPFGTYTVTGKYTAKNIGGCLAGYVYKNPCYSVSQTIEVEEGTTALSLSATYTSFALVLDTDECSGYKHYQSNNTYSNIEDWAEVGKIKIVYITPNETVEDYKLYKLKALPADETIYEPREYSMISGEKAGFIHIATGKWYKFSPRSTQAEIGDIGIGFPEWEQGATE